MRSRFLRVIKREKGRDDGVPALFDIRLNDLLFDIKGALIVSQKDYVCIMT